MVESQIKDAIKIIKENQEFLENTSMRDIIEGSTGKKVITFDRQNHSEILEDLISLGNIIKEKFFSTPITRDLFQEWRDKKVNAFRNNEVGDYCEFLIKDTFDKNKTKFNEIKKIEHLRGKGYPDLKALTNSKVIFIEVKATSRPETGSARDFYYSIGSASDRKIDSEALHLLLGFITKQVKSGFSINGFKIVDVSKIRVRLKPEFNTDNVGIYSETTIIYQG